MLQSKRVSHLLLATLIFVSLGLIIRSATIFGQELLSKQGLELTPPSQEVKTDPGKTVTIKVRVRNPSATSLPIQTRVEDFTASGDEGQITLGGGDQYSVTKWTTLSPGKFTLAPKGERVVTATITVPTDAAGGRYGAIVFGITPTSAADLQNAAAVSQEIASLFLLKIAGPVNETLVLDKITAPAFLEFGPIEMSMRLTNSGNIYSKITGLIHVTDLLGRTTADIVVKPTNIFPGADRKIPVILNKSLLIGPYKATAALYYGADNKVINGTTTFIVFPVRIVALLIVVCTLLYAGRKRLRKASKALFG